MAAPAPTGSVSIGRYRLEVGGAPGTLIEPARAPPADDAASLKRALAEEPRDAGAVAEPVIDSAAEVTARIEQAVALMKDLAAGGVAGRDVPARVDLMLDLLGRLDRQGRWEEARRLARALSGVLALLFRWVDLVRSLKLVGAAAARFADRSALAWSEHELGTLHLAAGDLSGANRKLEEASRIRRELGDRAGLAATEHNLEVLCRRLRAELRDERGPPRHARRLLVAAGAVILLLLIGGVAGAALDDDDPPERAPGADEEEQPAPPGTATLRVEPPVNGSVRSDPPGIACPTSCERAFAEGSQVALTPTANEGFVFEAWSGDCTGGGECGVTMSADRSVAAAFDPTPAQTVEVSVTVVGEISVSSEPEGIDCGGVCSAPFPAGEQVVLSGSDESIDWTGGCTGTGPSCAFAPAGNVSVTATFDPAEVE